ncbi:tripartite tricarboxylate transporter TctB family protein [Salipaludibacillus aurantiacus]|uniref:Putative tricarboxylic transport membrane protein n=1 Tax=Salipaludibacillus aurantiacus TaxID=1601833 RepID=A0A1H9UCT4_9BACI|nr:tripartite tricarboxylate transporter TctB family protein [Salipaludibacillus aurantiacus]SES07159.1 putative tricarboxylic transport membrane protein [Salipaludibacillus aurantiacus]
MLPPYSLNNLFKEAGKEPDTMNVIKQLRANQIIAIILFLFSIFYLYVAFQIPDYALPRPVDSDLFPKVLGITMGLLSIALFFEKDKLDEKEAAGDPPADTSPSDEGGGQKKEADVSVWQKPETQIVVTVAAVGAYIFLLERAGFPLTTLFFVFGMTWFYGFTRHVVNAIVAGFIAFGFYFLLTRGLGVYLPPGLLPF